MQETHVELEGILREDGTLVLDRRPGLPPGRVRVVLQSVAEAAAQPGERRPFLQDRFRQLAAEWRRDVGPLSSVSAIVQHPAYQQIIALGRDVVPLILRELEREPDHWFAALRAITGADPVAPEDHGRMDRMAAAWVRWGRDHGFTR